MGRRHSAVATNFVLGQVVTATVFSELMYPHDHSAIELCRRVLEVLRSTIAQLVVRVITSSMYHFKNFG